MTRFHVALRNIVWDTSEEDSDVVLEQPPVYELGLRVEAEDPEEAVDVALDMASDMTGWLILDCDTYPHEVFGEE